jgi:hypothetical protein
MHNAQKQHMEAALARAIWNREQALAALVALIRRAAVPPVPRRATPTRASRERRLEGKAHRAGVKRGRTGGGGGVRCGGEESVARWGRRWWGGCSCDAVIVITAFLLIPYRLPNQSYRTKKRGLPRARMVKDVIMRKMFTLMSIVRLHGPAARHRFRRWREDFAR